MAFYRVDRTDATEIGEYDAFIVRASGPKQALAQVLAGPAEQPFKGFKADGSNAVVSRLVDGRATDPAVVLGSYFGA
jgi:hypothetical protein